MNGTKDPARITRAGMRTHTAIHDVQCFERPNIVTRNGVTAELYRADWGVGSAQLAQILHVSLRPAAISAWHQHRLQTDHIFCILGALKLVIFDDRPDSPSRGVVDEYLLHPARPQLLVVPPYLWHGLQNLDSTRDACFINAFDRVYDHDDPDEYRLALGCAEIPYSFG